MSFAGFLDASYLTAKHYLHFEVTCSFLNGCEQVLTSPYSVLLGVPVALLGVLYYLGVFLSAVAFIDRKKPIFLKAVVLFPIVGFALSVWFVFVQAFLLEAFCLYCVVSALISICLFILTLSYFFAYRFHSIDKREERA